MRADLAQLQLKFAHALSDNDFIASALADFKGDAAINRERFDCYRANVNGVLQQSCANAYPVLRKLLGEHFFDDLALGYAHAHPSQSGNLTEFGAAMPDFIRTVESCSAYPYLSDVAALEWLVHRAYFMQHQNPVTLAEFAAVPAEQLGELRCTLQPCCALIASPWAVAEIWQAHQSDDGDSPVFPDQIERASYSLVWRYPWQTSWQVQVTSISAGSYAALTALQRGETLGSALEQAFSADPEFAVQTELADWLHKQLLVSLTLN